MELKNVEEILKSHKLRVTEGRMEVLQYFVEKDQAISYKDLEENFKDVDRVTLYRTLQSFMDKGILHRIPVDTGETVYGLCHDTCQPDQHQHDHLHFTCQLCGKTECIDGSVPELELPGYEIQGVNVMLKGICRDCREN